MDYVSDLSVRAAFNWLAFLKDEARKQKLEEQKVLSKYKK
jgi:hypothetical protein